MAEPRAVNDCGKWINNVGNGQRFDGTYYEPGTSRLQYDAVGSCDVWNVSPYISRSVEFS